MIEKFPKFSGLNHTKAINLQKKSEKGLITIKADSEKDNFLIGDYINSRDTIIFDLEFSEIWLEVEMLLSCEGVTNKASNKINFELKVSMEEPIKKFKNMLIKMGLDTWKRFTIKDKSCYDYYLYSNFKYNFYQTLEKEHLSTGNHRIKSVQNSLFQSTSTGKRSFHLEDNILPLNLNYSRNMRNANLKNSYNNKNSSPNEGNFNINNNTNVSNTTHMNNSNNNNVDPNSIICLLNNYSRESSELIIEGISHCVEMEDFSGIAF